MMLCMIGATPQRAIANGWQLHLASSWQVRPITATLREQWMLWKAGT
ncbi:hypothetical protein [Chloroflexus sp.]